MSFVSLHFWEGVGRLEIWAWRGMKFGLGERRWISRGLAFEGNQTPADQSDRMVQQKLSLGLAPCCRSWCGSSYAWKCVLWPCLLPASQNPQGEHWLFGWQGHDFQGQKWIPSKHICCQEFPMICRNPSRTTQGWGTSRLPISDTLSLWHASCVGNMEQRMLWANINLLPWWDWWPAMTFCIQSEKSWQRPWPKPWNCTVCSSCWTIVLAQSFVKIPLTTGIV